MRYFLIAGEASGDLHGAHLIHALRETDAKAEFRCYGGGHMRAAGGCLLCHYQSLAYMGFVQVALHAKTILRGLSRCKRQIAEWRPDAVILIDYPGFNLKVARYVKQLAICPVFYYISPKIWAWKEGRIANIRRDVDALYSILPFEKDFFEKKHRYPILYVGNPTQAEVAQWRSTHTAVERRKDLIALFPGSRRQEVSDNLSRMFRAVAPLAGFRLAIAAAPAIEDGFYKKIIDKAGIGNKRTELVRDSSFMLFATAAAALVTSGTATLEAALLGAPQVVCYYMRGGWLINWLRPCFLKVPYISLVNLIAGHEVVPELVAGEMDATHIRRQLVEILPCGAGREAQLNGYAEVSARLGDGDAPRLAARDMVERLRRNSGKRAF